MTDGGDARRITDGTWLQIKGFSLLHFLKHIFLKGVFYIASFDQFNARNIFLYIYLQFSHFKFLSETKIVNIN